MEDFNQDYEQPQLGMKWFKFMINFALWVGAIANLVVGIQHLFPRSIEVIGPKWLNVFYGAALCALAVYQVSTRFALAKFKSNGPSMLYRIYIFNILLTIIYNGALYIITGGGGLVNILGSVIGTLIWLLINKKYFNNRKHLFIY